MKPKFNQLGDLFKDKSEFQDLPDLLDKNPRGSTFLIRKLEYPINSEEYVCYKTFIPQDIIMPEKLSQKEKKKFLENKRLYLFKKAQRFYRELYITNRARHPCIIELLNFDLRPKLNDSAVVYRYYEYGTLADCIKKGKYRNWRDPTTYTLIIYGIARGLRYLHHLKILHRDIKPHNIVIGADFRPRIADFDMAKETNDDDRNSGEIGTLIYMAPEIAFKNGEFKFSYPADVFALALVFWALTNGSLYRPTLDLQKVREMDENEKHKALRKQIIDHYKKGMILTFNQSPGLENLHGLIEKMWSYDQKDRPTMDEVCKTLEDSDYWFPDTDEDDFNNYKNEIDNYEKEQLRLISNTPFYTQDYKYMQNKLAKSFDEEEVAYDLLSKMYDQDPQSIFTNFSYKQFRCLLKYCNHLNSEAEYLLGFTYYNGFRGIPKNYVLSFKYLQRSKLHGNKNADSLISTILYNIINIESDSKDESLKISSKVDIDPNDKLFDNLNNPKAQLLAGMVKEALGLNTEALRMYLKSAQNGSIEAKGRIGSLLFRSGQKLEEAKEFLKQASKWKCNEEAEIDNDERKLALVELGLLNLYSRDGLAEAIEIFYSLLIEEHPDAAYFLSIAYYKNGDSENGDKFKKIAIEQFSSEYQ